MLENLRVVIGGGLMGHGIAQVFAVADAAVCVHDPSPEILASVPDRIKENVQVLGMDPSCTKNIVLCAELEEAVSEANLVIEAVPEDLLIKQETFARLDAAAPVDCVLASNTSVMKIGDVAARVTSRERVLGTHWWNPPYLIPLVEVVQTSDTSPDVLARTMALLRAIGKTPVHIRRDVPGFVGNRLQHALWRQAFELIDGGVCDAEALDTIVRQGFGMRLAVLGPMENADLVGLDLTLAIHEYLLPTLDPPSAPTAGLRQRVAENHLGMQSGTGFRTWNDDAIRETTNRLVNHLARQLEVAKYDHREESG